MRRAELRILTWHVRGNYLYCLTQVPHVFCVLADEARSEGYGGRAGHLPWGDNVVELPVEQARSARFDCILFQSRQAWERNHMRQCGRLRGNAPPRSTRPRRHGRAKQRRASGG